MNRSEANHFILGRAFEKAVRRKPLARRTRATLLTKGAPPKKH
jgi:hypothetical protein